jgi:hypothetical protein
MTQQLFIRLHSVTQRYTALHSVTQRYNLKLMLLLF